MGLISPLLKDTFGVLCDGEKNDTKWGGWGGEGTSAVDHMCDLISWFSPKRSVL